MTSMDTSDGNDEMYEAIIKAAQLVLVDGSPQLKAAVKQAIFIMSCEISTRIDSEQTTSLIDDMSDA